MTRYLISFDEGDLVFPRRICPTSRAANAVVEASVVGADATVRGGPFRGKRTFVGGFAVVEVPSREQALEWAAKVAVA